MLFYFDFYAAAGPGVEESEKNKYNKEEF